MRIVTKLGICSVAAATLLTLPAFAQPRSDEPRGERERHPPPRHGRHPAPVQFDDYDNHCAITFQKDFCLGGDIKTQLLKTPMEKVATYGLKDVYQHSQQQGIKTTLYVIDGKVANVLREWQKSDRQPPGRGRPSSRHPERRGGRPAKGPLGAIFKIADGYAAQFDRHKGREAIGQILNEIEQKGYGGHTWDFEKWQFYTELKSNGNILAEAWVPALENQEKQAKKLQTGDVLNGLWHNKHPVELNIQSKNGSRFKGQLHFTTKSGRDAINTVDIEQLNSNQLEVVRYLSDGTSQRLLSRHPKGTTEGCYIWEMLLQQDISNSRVNMDGQLKLCRKNL